MTLLKTTVKDNTVTEKDIAEASKDTYINKTSINPDTFNDQYGILASYVAGSNLYVDFYRRRVPYINKQSISSTNIIMGASSSDVSLDLIKDMEMKLESPMEPEINPETQETTIAGTGIIYHGIKPNVGDIFLAKIAEEVGIFTINRSVALSIHRGTHYKVEFTLYCFMDDDIKANLDGSVRETLFFDKQSFFTKDAALLTTSKYEYLKDLTAFRKSLINRYMHLFYERQHETIIHPEGYLDAFLIEYVRSKISIEDHRHRVAQISNYYTSLFSGTIFNAVLNRSHESLEFPTADIFQFVHHLWDATLSSFDKSPIILPVNADSIFDTDRLSQKEGPHPFSYVFGPRLYKALFHNYETGEDTPADQIPENDNYTWFPEVESFSLKDNDYIDYSLLTEWDNDMKLTDLEQLVYNHITRRPIEQAEFRTLIMEKFPYPKMKPVDKFYWLPIILSLVDMQLAEIN